MSALRIADRYQLEERIGSGGMGTVWRATDEALGRQVAVKLLAAPAGSSDQERAMLVARFRQEARSAASLDHPNIVSIFDYGSAVLPAAEHEAAHETPYLVMRLLRGQTLAELLDRGGRLPVGSVVAMAAQVCDALVAAHEIGIVHRDIKPANLMVLDGGRDGSVQVLDFGIATFTEDTRTASARLTQTGSGPLGTVRYMAPERFVNQPVGASTDLYSLGCVLHELLCGQPPFGSDTVPGLMYEHLNVMPADPRVLRAEVPEPLAGLVGEMLSKEPGRRPSAAQALARLRRISQVETPGAPGAPGPHGMADAGAAGPTATGFGPAPHLGGSNGPNNGPNNGGGYGPPSQNPYQQAPTAVGGTQPVMMGPPLNSGPGYPGGPNGPGGPNNGPGHPRRARRIALGAAGGALALAMVVTAVVAWPFGDDGGGGKEGPGKGKSAGPTAPTGKGPDTRKTVAIGYQGDLSGAGKATGIEMRNSLLLLVDDVNKNQKLPYRLRLVEADDAGTPDGQSAAADKLAADKRVVGVVGSTYEPNDQQQLGNLVGRYADSSLAVVSPYGSTPGLSGEKFRTYYRTTAPSDLQPTRMAEYLDALSEESGGPKTIALISDAGSGYSAYFLSILRKTLGLKVVMEKEMSAQADTSDWDDAAKRAKDEGADAVFFAGLDQGLPKLDRALNNTGFKGLRFINSTALNYESTLIRGKWIASTTTCNTRYPDYKDFESAYGRRWGVPKRLGVVEAYDAGQAIANSLSEVPKKVKAGQLRRKVVANMGKNTKGGQCNPLTFTSDGYLSDANIFVATYNGTAWQWRGEIRRKQALGIDLNSLR